MPDRAVGTKKGPDSGEPEPGPLREKAVELPFRGSAGRGRRAVALGARRAVLVLLDALLMNLLDAGAGGVRRLRLALILGLLRGRRGSH